MEISQILYWTIIVFLIADFGLEMWLTLLNVKASRWPVPKVLEGLYDDEKYRTQQSYASENRKVSFLASTLSTLFTLCFFAFGGFAWLDGIVREMTGSYVLRSLLFYGFFFVTEFLLGLPFSIYTTFSIEERYGFNKSTPKLFAADAVKGLLLNAVLNGGLLCLAVWVYILTPEWFWLICFAGFNLVSLFFQYIYSDLIVPLFNKQTPLEEGELRRSIEAFARMAGFQLENIYVMDESKRSTKANAYFTGFGKKKRVVLFDTLIQQLTTDEIVGVLAHEIGHYKRRHLWKMMASDLVETFIIFWLLSLFVGSPAVAAAAGCAEPSFWINIYTFGMLLAPLGLLQNIVSNVVSRKHEREADDFAFHHGCGASEASALKKMSAQALSDLTPHPIVVFFEYSHPMLAERVESLERPFPIIWKEGALYLKSHSGGKDTRIPEEEYAGFLPSDKPGKGPKGL